MLVFGMVLHPNPEWKRVIPLSVNWDTITKNFCLLRGTPRFIHSMNSYSVKKITFMDNLINLRNVDKLDGHSQNMTSSRHLGNDLNIDASQLNSNHNPKQVLLQYVHNHQPFQYTDTNRLMIPRDELRTLVNLTGLKSSSIIRKLRLLSDPPQFITEKKKKAVREWIQPFLNEGARPSSIEIMEKAKEFKLSRIQLLHMIKRWQESSIERGKINTTKKLAVEKWIHDHPIASHAQVVTLANNLELSVKQCQNLIERIKDPSGTWTDHKKQLLHEALMKNKHNGEDFDSDQVAIYSKMLNVSKRQIMIQIKALNRTERNVKKERKVEGKWKSMLQIRQWLHDYDMKLEDVSQEHIDVLHQLLNLPTKIIKVFLSEMKQQESKGVVTTDKKDCVSQFLATIGYRKPTSDEYGYLQNETGLTKRQLYRIVSNIRKKESVFENK